MRLRLWLAIVALGCDGGERRFERTDQGTVLIEAGAAADGIAVTVKGNKCLSSTCDVERSASCTVSRDGELVVVASKLAWTSHEGSCTIDCETLDASCTLAEPLADGSYQVVHGDDAATLEVAAGQIEGACFGDQGATFVCPE
jgi:hypothetical protein